VLAAVARHAGKIFRYPQGSTPRLAAAIAARHGVDPSCVVTGNGSDEIIDLLIRVRAAPGRHNIVVSRPCFGLYVLQAELCGVEARRAPLREDFSFDFDALLRLCDAETAIVFVTTPDNPSGFCPPASVLRDFAAALPSGCLLAADEAYMDFADDESGHSLLPLLAELSNLAVLRTFSKSFGMAGLRLGYGLMPKQLACHLRRARLPFSVSVLAEEAGLAALEDAVFRERSLDLVRRGRRELDEKLRELGCRVWPSQANFLMFSPPADGPSAPDCFESLLRRGIIIRHLASYGLPELLRVSVGSDTENACFLEACTDLFARR
jgi:histidinol-phosphate aminotransferase